MKTLAEEAQEAEELRKRILQTPGIDTGVTEREMACAAHGGDGSISIAFVAVSAAILDLKNKGLIKVDGTRHNEVTQKEETIYVRVH